jgi:energy-coupling factor transporter ATP-binding protein EcfA2
LFVHITHKFSTFDIVNMISKVDKDTIEANVCKYFKPPIYYLNDNTKHVLSSDIIEDLELEESQDISGTPMMDYIVGSSSTLARIVRPDMIKYYTTNKSFIKNTASLLKKTTPDTKIEGYEHVDCDEVYNIWCDLKTDDNFRDKYNYIDWDKFEYLNNNSLFLQILSVYNLSAPVIALLVPVIMLFIPFLIIQAQGHDLSLSNYFKILKQVAQRHAIGQLLTNFSDVTWNYRIYLIISAGVYMLSLYQNIQICVKFYKNMFAIHDILFKMCNFMEMTVKRAEIFADQTKNMKSYKKFNNLLDKHCKHLTNMSKEIRTIAPFCLSYNKLSDMGIVLKCFYDMYSNEEYNETISFSFGFNGYLSTIDGIKSNILEGHMNYGTLKENTVSKEKKSNLNNELSAKNIYYPVFIGKSSQKNNVKIRKDCILTGPNASGKTTLLKSLLISIIFTQQYGCGFYDKMSFIPYDYIHCYLNIPDTSGRDSLFQSESRKCKKILDKVHTLGENKRHFCVFDELYSGTNPREAVKCGYAYLSHLSSSLNIQYLLTTHYTELCDKLSKDNDVQNYKMMVKVSDDNNIQYTYKIVKGINDVDGGVEVLRQMNYPSYILSKMDDLD